MFSELQHTELQLSVFSYHTGFIGALQQKSHLKFSGNYCLCSLIRILETKHSYRIFLAVLIPRTLNNVKTVYVSCTSDV